MEVRVALMVALLVVAVVPGWCLREGTTISPITAYNPDEECKHIKFSIPGQENAVREAVLRKMCLKAAPHVDVNKTLKQFAVFLVHRDNFDDTPKWHSGNAKDVINDPYWAVNDVTVLQATKYQWYVHGLPMWPLPYQTLDNATVSKRLTLKKKQPVDWPNYGMATPIYFASKAWRDQAWSVEEFFQQEKKNSPFKNHEKFHKLVREVVDAVDGNKVESYSEWPFLRLSLPPMISSMIQRNKGLCPDEVYVYLRYTPCHPQEAPPYTCIHPAHDARLALTKASCRTTTVIIGYTKEYGEEDVPI